MQTFDSTVGKKHFLAKLRGGEERAQRQYVVGEVVGSSMPECGRQQKVETWLPAATRGGGRRNSPFFAPEFLHYYLCITSSKHRNTENLELTGKQASKQCL
jgi:hypothetical protein